MAFFISGNFSLALSIPASINSSALENSDQCMSFVSGKIATSAVLAQTTNLLISEYVEGSSNNKALH